MKAGKLAIWSKSSPNPAQIQPKSQFLFPEKSPTAGLHYDDLDANQG